jgi:hypothetical protein
MAFSNPVVGGETLIRDSIQSENFEPGVAGWAVNRDGTAEFNDVTARGDIVANSVAVTTDEGTITIQDGGTANEIILNGTPGQFSDPARITTSSPAGSDRLEIEGPTNTSTPGIRPRITLLDDGSQRETRFDGVLTNGLGTELDFPSSVPVRFQVLRPVGDELGSDSARTVTSTSYTTALGVDTLSVVIPRAASQTITVGMWAQADITAGAGFISFEVRDINSGGTQILAPTDGNGIILVNLAGSRITYSFQHPFTSTEFDDNQLFVRMMAKTSSGGTLTIQRAKLWAKVEP